MQKKALVIIDLQNDITKNYKEIIGNVNKAIDWAIINNIHVVYIRHEYLSDTMKKFKPNTKGSEFVSDLKIVSSNIFTKNILNACSSQEFMDFIGKNEIDELFITGADAFFCVKSTVYNLLKSGYKVNVISDGVTSFDKRKLPEMLQYYESKGGKLIGSSELPDSLG